MARVFIPLLRATSTMSRATAGGMMPRFGAAEHVAVVPDLQDLTAIEAHSVARVPSAFLARSDIMDVARRVQGAFGQGFYGTALARETDPIDERSFLPGVLVAGQSQVVVTDAMRVADTPGGPACGAPRRRLAGGARVGDRHRPHRRRPCCELLAGVPRGDAPCLPRTGPVCRNGRGRVSVHLRRDPSPPTFGGPPSSVALLRWGMAEDRRLIEVLPCLGYEGAVIAGMGAATRRQGSRRPRQVRDAPAGHLASRCMTGPVLTGADRDDGSERDPLGCGLIPAGCLSGPKTRLLLGLVLRSAAGPATESVCTSYQ
ncbi:asparaginase domain-containing protein [Roseomonas sp. CCTCC AB2023176]|uniref:asparaginase domain-containing protein n=1 Tax=Roseomonas sp. CCTCC AB2023176 TaxID=3342640 RepID=UPI0035D79576